MLNVNLSKSSFINADLLSRFFNNNLRNAIFKNSSLNTARFDQSDLTGVRFENVDLTETDFRNAKNVDKAIFNNCYIKVYPHMILEERLPKFDSTIKIVNIENSSSPKIKIDVISTSVPNKNPELANPSQEKLKVLSTSKKKISVIFK